MKDRFLWYVALVSGAAIVAWCVAVAVAGCSESGKFSARRAVYAPPAMPSPVPAPTSRSPLPSLRPTYVNGVRQDFLVCAGCHTATGPAGTAGARLLFTTPSLQDDPADYAQILAFVDLANPALSGVLLKASGFNPSQPSVPVPHGGGQLWIPGVPGSVGGGSYARVLDWISQGATFR